MPRASRPEHTRMKAMRSRWLGSMFAWILNTTPVIAGSVASTVRVVAFWLAGGGAWRMSASSRSRTPKFLSALPKNTGVRWPWRNDSRSKRPRLGDEADLLAPAREVLGLEQRGEPRVVGAAEAERRRRRGPSA